MLIYVQMACNRVMKRVCFPSYSKQSQLNSIFILGCCRLATHTGQTRQRRGLGLPHTLHEGTILEGPQESRLRLAFPSRSFTPSLEKNTSCSPFQHEFPILKPSKPMAKSAPHHPGSSLWSFSLNLFKMKPSIGSVHLGGP